MTKPNQFIVNTDYLSIAQSDNVEYTASFPSETFSAGTYNRDQDFSISTTKGALDRILISRNGDDYTVGSYRLVDVSSSGLATYFSINVYRPSSNTIRVRLHIHSSRESFTVPAQTIKIKVACFQPPNVF